MGRGRYDIVFACLWLSIKQSQLHTGKDGWIWWVNVYDNFNVENPCKNQRINWGKCATDLADTELPFVFCFLFFFLGR